MHKDLLIGSHMSISGGFDNALNKAIGLNCNVVQIFTKNARQWSPPPLRTNIIPEYLRIKNENDILVSSHGSYLLNIGSFDKELRSKSINNLIDEMYRAQKLEIPYIIFHPGNSKEISPNEAILNIAESLNIILGKSDNKKTMLLLETTAGTKNSIGSTFEHLRDIMDGTKYNDRLGICFDTCHTFAAGYDITNIEGYDQTMESFDKIIGLERIKFFHLNDCKGKFGAGLDRHEHIGKGNIGKDAFKFILNDDRFSNIGKCLETPKGDDDKFDKMNLKTLRKLYENP